MPTYLNKLSKSPLIFLLKMTTCLLLVLNISQISELSFSLFDKKSKQKKIFRHMDEKSWINGSKRCNANWQLKLPETYTLVGEPRFFQGLCSKYGSYIIKNPPFPSLAHVCPNLLFCCAGMGVRTGSMLTLA